MNSFLGQRRVILACLTALGVAALAPSIAEAAAKPDPTVKKSGFRLFARAGGSLRVNQVQCGIISDGQICVDSTGSSTIPGSVWPKGTNNQYTFNSGISIAGVIGPEISAWAGDTTGAFFFDGAGKQNGEQVEPIYNASDPADFNAWPDFALVPSGSDPGAAIYDPLLQGTISASQGDVYFLSWDGNPSALTGRPHPLGVVVETRGLAWNFPAGNQDIIYFVYTLYNVSSVEEADYALVRPALRTLLLGKAQEFQSGSEAAFGIDIPAGGYTLENVFMAFAADQDVADATSNYSSFNIPFALGVTYHETFTPLPGNSFDPGIHAPPFLPAPGFVGTKYLRSPIIAGSDPPQESGLVVAGLTTNRGAFPDANNVSQLYRYLSARPNAAAGDPQCNSGDPTVTRICFINEQPSDTRTFQSSGPLTLPPGGQATIVVGYIFAAPLSTGKCSTVPCPVTMSPDPLTLLAATPGTPDVDAIDSAMGYRGLVPTAGAVLTQNDFLVAPNSLLAKSLVAQTVFDNQFLLPFAPTAPDFFLVPGDNEVSILWRPSPSEASGDAFFAIASNPTTLDEAGNPIPNPLYDPNYRQNDVEGYRIYRGRTDTPNQLELLAQFDYSGTIISDFRGLVFGQENKTCAPELAITAGCPVAFDNPVPPAPFTTFVDIPLVGEIIQVDLDDRVALANGEALLSSSDTAITGGGSGLPQLADTEVPFAFTDDGSGLLSAPRNNVRYFYSVTAFDINSFFSGPSSLESQRVTKPVTPVRPASNVDAASLSTVIVGDDDVPLDPDVEWELSSTTGRFTGSPPPTDGVEGIFAPLVPVLLPAVNLTASIDSVKARSSVSAECGGVTTGLFPLPAGGTCYIYYVTFNRDGTLTPFVSRIAEPIWSSFGDPISLSAQLGALPVLPDAAVASRFGIPAGAGASNAAVGATLRQYIDWSSFEGQAARRGRIGNNSQIPSCVGLETGCSQSASPGGSRWFSGADETLDHPAVSIKVGGGLPGVDTVWAPIHHVDQDPVTPDGQSPANSAVIQFFGYAAAGASRQADVRFTWGAGGTLTEVRDLTHHLPVLFAPDLGASYGFVSDGNADGRVDWQDFNFIPGIVEFWANNVGANGPVDPAQAPVPLTPTPTVGPVSTSFDVTIPGATGQGFGLYINGERYIFQLTGGALPAAGATWTLRTYTGTVSATAGAATVAPSGYAFTARTRSPVVPGLQVQFTVERATTVLAPGEGDLDAVHTVPDPYYVTSGFQATDEIKVIKFVNLPSQAIIRIYSSSGVLVSVIEHNSVTLGGDETWDVRNRNNQIVASGVYFYHIESGNQRRIGRFTVVNFAQ